MPELTPDQQARREELADRWWHSIELPDGTVTPGYKTAEQLDAEWAKLHLPDLHGRSVLDIGAWDGYFSLRAERAGARSVTALDHFVWSYDPIEKMLYEDRCRREGVPVKSYEEVPELWRPDELPGKRSFDFAREVLDSKVESVVGDFMAMDVDALPRADVVFFLGVLYHLKDPLGALERLRAVTGELAVIETEAVHLPTYPDLAMAEFVVGDDLYGDPTNWWAPNLPGLVGLAKAAGFSSVEAVPGLLEEPEASYQEYRSWARRFGPKEWRKRVGERPNLVYRYRAVIHARP